VRNILAGTVVHIEQAPDSAYAEALVDIGGAKLRARLTRAAVADLGLEQGTPVYALVKSVAFQEPDRGRDIETGRRSV
jgi:molybdate transport system ATP-binding protein